MFDFSFLSQKSGVYNVDGYNGTKSVKINTVIFNGGEVLWSTSPPPCHLQDKDGHSKAFLIVINTWMEATSDI